MLILSRLTIWCKVFKDTKVRKAIRVQPVAKGRWGFKDTKAHRDTKVRRDTKVHRAQPEAKAIKVLMGRGV